MTEGSEIQMCPEWHFEVGDFVRAESDRYSCKGSGVVINRQFQSHPDATHYAYSVVGEFFDDEFGDVLRFTVAWFLPGELTRVKLEPYDRDICAS